MIGVNTWVWVSPLTDESLAALAPRIADSGFDVVELPVEHLGDRDPENAAALPEERGLALDTYHMNIEEKDPLRTVRLAGDRIASIQVCGADRGAPGADHFDWPGFAAAVRDVGYTGPLVIESFTADNQTIATAASVWRPSPRARTPSPPKDSPSSARS